MKKNGADNNSNSEGKKGENNSVNVVVLKVDMHCDGCASKIMRNLRGFPGVETLSVESATGKITVTGKVDPTKLKEKLSEKTKKKVELLSPQPKKEKEKKHEEKKEPPVTTAVLKVALHCQGCLDKIAKTVKRTKGVHDMAIDEEKETVTVKGTMDVKALAQNLAEKLKKKVEVAPPKKDKDNDKENGGGDNGGSGKKNKNKGGGGGGNGNGNDQNNMLVEHNNIMEYLTVANPPPHFGFGYGVPHGYVGLGHGGAGHVGGGYAYVPIYPDQLHLHHAPQIFSDENPNACSVM